ncbi:MAG TPA: hypothetical protein VN894_11795 [Polyangiaceae bacterium]|nr:hypothetical protein [Polyangiaceae bacterium]
MQPLTPWASTLLYPAGAFSWSGTPTKLAPAVTFITPNAPQGLSAQNLNYLLNQRDAILAQVAIGEWVAAVANWNPPLTDVGAPTLPVVTPLCACWDAYYEQWIVAGAAGSSAFLTCSYDGGKSYFPLAGAIPTPTVRSGISVATNPATGDLSLVRSDGTNCSVTQWAGGTGTPIDTVQPALASANLGTLAYFNGAFWFVGSSGFGGTSSWTGFSATSTSGAGVWANESGTLPASFASSGANPQQQFISAQSPTTLAVAMCGLVQGSSTSRLMSMTTSSGWADITPAVLGGTAQQIRGLCYEANDQLWGLLTQDASSNSYLYTSPDLATWTLVQTFTGFWSCGVAAIGAVFAVLVYDATAAEGGNRIVYSSTVATLGAGSTWSFAAYAEGISGEFSELPANPAGLLLGNAGAVQGSIAGGGVLGAANLVGSQLLRCQFATGGTVAASNIAGYSGAVPTATIAGAVSPGPPTPSIPSNLGPKANVTMTAGNNDNMPWGNLGVIRLDVTMTGAPGAATLGGIAGGTDGQVLELWFNFNQNVTIANLDGSDNAGNRIQTPTGVNTVMPAPGATSGNSIPFGYMRLVYDSALDGSSGGWRVS